MLAPMKRTAKFLVVVAAAALALAGCAQSSSSGSRHTLYDSIDGLAADSSSIVVGEVTSQSRDGDATISAVEVANAPDNPQLGGNLPEPAEPVTVGETIEVRQDAAPFLESGEQYLLFITPTQLSGDAADQYFITGAVAGLYVREGDEFQRVVTDSGDELPDTITAVGDEGE